MPKYRNGNATHTGAVSRCFSAHEEWEQNVFVKALKAGDMDEFRHLEKAFDEINNIEERIRFQRGEHPASNKTWADIG